MVDLHWQMSIIFCFIVNSGRIQDSSFILRICLSQCNRGDAYIFYLFCSSFLYFFISEFLASLLDNLEPEKSSAVWIGLYRNLSHGSHSYDWSDGKKPQFIKPIIRDHQLSVYGHTFVSRPTISIKSKSMSVCHFLGSLFQLIYHLLLTK